MARRRAAPAEKGTLEKKCRPGWADAISRGIKYVLSDMGEMEAVGPEIA